MKLVMFLVTLAFSTSMFAAQISFKPRQNIATCGLEQGATCVSVNMCVAGMDCPNLVNLQFDDRTIGYYAFRTVGQNYEINTFLGFKMEMGKIHMSATYFIYQAGKLRVVTLGNVTVNKADELANVVLRGEKFNETASNYMAPELRFAPLF